jgi:hypothetical protein
MDCFRSTLAGESANPCKSFFLCSLRFLLWIQFPFEVNRPCRLASPTSHGKSPAPSSLFPGPFRSGPRKPKNGNDFEHEEAEIAEIQPFESKIRTDFLSPNEEAGVFL